MNKKIFLIIFIFAAVLFGLGYRAAMERKGMTEGKNVGLEKIERQEVGEKIIDYRPDACLENESEKEIDRAWPIFQGNFFSISYPIGFEALEKEKSDYGIFQSADEKVVFAVYSPQWTGEPKKILVQYGENEVLDKEEEIKIDCETELGSGAVQRIRRTEIRDKDGRYERSVIDIRLIGPEGSGETRKTFSFRYEDGEYFKKNKDSFEKFMRSLMQVAD